MILSSLCYLQRDGKTLMLYRNKKDKDFHEGKYNGIGGKFEEGESPEQCLVREVKEETNLDLIDFNYEGIITFPKFDGVNDWYTFVYSSSDFNGQIMDSDEGTLYWIDDDKLTGLNLWEGDKYFLEWIYSEEYANKKFSAVFIYKEKKYISHSVKFY